MSLETYNAKRRFDETPEPAGGEDHARAGRFVVQRHRASHLHYDLRLEMGGVLKSWAVPKGPSLNPADKRLAVQTEDHPVKYLTFHGTIPKGNYGAGEMTIWDTGTFSILGSEKNAKKKPVSPDAEGLKQLKNGNLKIRFDGTRLRGDFSLVRTRTENERHQWLLIKKADAYSVDVPYDAEIFAGKKAGTKAGKKRVHPKKIAPDAESEEPLQAVKPMLAKTATKIFDDPAWIYELKWDGYRLLALADDGNVQLYSRNGLAQNVKFAPIAEALANLGHRALLDGEVVLLNTDGLPDFQRLQNYDGSPDKNLRYTVFDLLYLNGHSTMGLPLTDRKEILKELLEVADLENVVYCDHIATLGTAFYEKAIDMGFEGVIAKKASGKYHPGNRSEEWLKFKKIKELDAVICGYTESDGVAFGSLILGAYRDGILEYIGNCGTGFDSKMRTALLENFKPLATKKCPFKSPPALKGRKPHWLLPSLVCEVSYSEITKAGKMRHPVFRRLRTEKAPADVTAPGPSLRPLPDKARDKKKTSAKSDEKQMEGEPASDADLEINGRKVAVSNPAKVYFPKEGIRKYDLMEYYIRMAEVILPYLINRPQNLHRHPDGIAKPGFYQKDAENIPDWIETFTVYSKSSNRDIDYLLCQDEATLLYMVNLGCIELNPWNSVIGNPENPTYTVIDIDPGEKTPFVEVVETARAVKEVLDLAEIQGYCKTSGATGLHVYIPLAGNYSYDEAASFAQLICVYVHHMLPEITSMERTIKAREGKIYLDYLQNKRGQTLASAYCARPRPGATVSTPLKWEEVNKRLKVKDFTIFTVPDRVDLTGDLFRNVLTQTTDIAKAIERLDAL